MRQIKFRGKTKDGRWLYGDILQLNNSFRIAPHDGNWHDFMPPKSALGTPSIKYEVIPETISQFTGLLDKDGKEIYEGDIVMWGHLNDGWSDETPHRKAIVKLFPDLHFLAFTKTEFGNPHTFHYGSFAYKDTHKYLEIIGNTFDNPELLKGDKQ